jgi:Putative beta-barrel porin-2, OmpL-like. bbp2
MLRSKVNKWSWFAFALMIVPGVAHAVDLPSPYTFEAGPLGTLQFSGGADAYAYALSGAGSDASLGALGTNKRSGIEFLNGLIQLQKPDGLVQFNLQVGAVGSQTLGARPSGPSIQTFSTGPVRTASITIAPIKNLSISAGQLGSVEGFESGVDWENFNLLTTSLWYVENSQSVGVKVSYTYGPASGTIIFGDGFDTNVWNYLQLKLSYAFNDNNNLTLYGATNLGSTGLGARFYGNATTPYNSITVASAGVANVVNSSMVGGYHIFTMGDLTLVPELQYTWTKANPSVGVQDFSSHFGAALFANYKFGESSFSLGGWAQFFSSNGRDFWFVNPGAQGYSLAIGPTWTPTWGKKHLFVRGDVGWLHLTNTGREGTVAFGSNGDKRDQVTLLIEVGALF